MHLHATLLVGLSLVVSASALAQSPLVLPFAADQVGSAGTTLYFDLTVQTPVTFTSIDVNSSSPVGATGLLQVWMGPSTWVGASTRPALWTSVASGTVTSLDVDVPSPCTFSQPFTLGPGTYALAIEYQGIAAAYSTGDGTNQAWSNSELQFRAGGASSARFATSTLMPRVFNGIFHYTLGGTQLPLAVASAYGAGCYAAQTSFCENFPSPFSGNLVDLDHTTIRMVPNAREGYDVTRTNSAFVVPPGVPPLPLGDDTISIENLPFVFPYPGGSTTNLWVSSNGFLGLESFDNADFSPSEQEMIDLPARILPAWMDLNPGAPGSGGIHYEIDPSNQFVTITYNGVWLFGTVGTAVTRFQVVLRANGEIEIRYGQVRNAGSPCLVGFSTGNGNLGLLPVDYDLSVVPSFQTSYRRALYLRPGLRPVLGGVISVCTENIPANTIASTNLLSYVQHPTGIDLSSLGAPGCARYCDMDAAGLLLGTGTQVRPLGVVPTDPIWVGLEFYSQSASLVPGSNALGVITSNGAKYRIGAL